MKISLWSKIKWLVNVYKELRKSTYPLTAKGTRLMLGSLPVGTVSSIVLSLDLSYELPISFIEISINDVSFFTLLLSGLTWLVGFCMVVYEIRYVNTKARNVARVIITGLPGTASEFPNNILSKAEQVLAREPVQLSIEEPFSKDISKQIERYNGELCVDLFKRFILHSGCEKIYIGGLARVPFLVAYGAFLRNITAEVIYFDKSHHGDKKWFTLNEEDSSIAIIKGHDVSPSEKGDIGIAIGFTFPIKRNHLPSFISDNTLFIEPNVNTDSNLIMNMSNLQRIGGEIKSIVNRLSNNSNVKRIHFFLCVQSVMALEIGRCFQEGMHKNWVIHNFDGNLGEYNWALELSVDGINKFVIENKNDEKIEYGT